MTALISGKLAWEHAFPALTALAGVFLTLIVTQGIEARKPLQEKRVEVLSEFAAFAWNNQDEDGYLTLVQKLGALSVYADDKVLTALAAYYGMDCVDDRPQRCQYSWAKAVNEMRRQAGLKRVDEDIIVKLFWPSVPDALRQPDEDPFLEDL